MEALDTCVLVQTTQTCQDLAAAVQVHLASLCNGIAAGTQAFAAAADDQVRAADDLVRAAGVLSLPAAGVPSLPAAGQDLEGAGVGLHLVCTNVVHCFSSAADEKKVEASQTDWLAAAVGMTVHTAAETELAGTAKAVEDWTWPLLAESHLADYADHLELVAAHYPGGTAAAQNVEQYCPVYCPIHHPAVVQTVLQKELVHHL